MTMWQSILFLLCCVASRVTSQKIKALCEKVYEFPETSVTGSPSMVAGLNVTLVTVSKERKLNISWAINIDASNTYLKGTWITSESSYICKYEPPFAEANLTGLKEWFYHIESVRHGLYTTNVFNVPLPPLNSGDQKLTKRIWVPRLTTASVTTGTSSVTTGQQQPTTSIPETKEIKDLMAIVIGVVASLIILTSCFVIYKMCVSFSGFEIVPVAPMTTVSVVVVYPAETPAFQRAVVSLAEFLQWYGGCRVVIDLWQQEKIAKLGPLRWLAEQVKDADRVLIISPQAETPSFMPVHSSPTKNLPEHSIPAAADDLYPLILNMVASHARSPNEQAKFWVVQLHADKDKKSCVLLPELRTCRAFCLMKDLKSLCNSLHAQRKIVKKITSLLFKPEVFYSQNSTAKLREAIEMLGAKKPGMSDGILDKHLVC